MSRPPSTQGRSAASGIPSPRSHLIVTPTEPDDEKTSAAAQRHDIDLSHLQTLAVTELTETARQEGLELPPNLARKELVFNILKARLEKSGLGYGEGVLDVLPDGFGFLRSQHYGYENGPDDIYVSPSQIRRLNLKPGHQLAGPVRPPKKGEKYFALLRVDTVNGGTIAELRHRVPFADRTPVLPHERLHLDAPGTAAGVRALDLLAPMGLGQRCLILSPPHCGRTLLLILLARALLATDQDLHVIVCLVDNRPEDATEVRRQTGTGRRCEVVSSTFDQPQTRHVALSEMILARAQRLVEAGQDVVLLLDSLTALVRAYNQTIPHSGKIVTPGLDSSALLAPKRLFGAARCAEEGGSLTVIATALTHTESRVDQAIAEEFQGKGNCEIVLEPDLAALRLFPPLDVRRTGTRREDVLLCPEDLATLRALRKTLSERSPQEALEDLLARIEDSPDNRVLLEKLSRGNGARP